MREDILMLDLEGISLEELQEMQEEVNRDLASIKLQITKAKSLAAVEGKYADRDWWVRVNQALKIKGRQSQQIQKAIGLANKKRKQEHQLRFERRFMEIAKQELEPEVFQRIMSQVTKEMA
jgi:hypothetical protein